MHMTVLRVATVGLVVGALYYLITQREKSRHPTGVTGPANLQRDCNCNYRPTLGCIHEVRGGTAYCTRCCNVPFVSENDAIPIATDYLDCAPLHTAAISACNQGINQNQCNRWTVARGNIASSFPIGIRVGRVSIGARLILADDVKCNPDVNTCVPNTEVI